MLSNHDNAPVTVARCVVNQTADRNFFTGPALTVQLFSTLPNLIPDKANFDVPDPAPAPTATPPAAPPPLSPSPARQEFRGRLPPRSHVTHSEHVQLYTSAAGVRAVVQSPLRPAVLAACLVVCVLVSWGFSPGQGECEAGATRRRVWGARSMGRRRDWVRSSVRCLRCDNGDWRGK